MSCNNNNCGCSSCDQTTINQSSENIVEYTRFAYSSANSAYANAQNAEQSAIDAATTLANAVLKTGSTMTGLLLLSGDPIAALGSSTKQYTDSKVAKSGDTMTGFLTLNGNPVSNLQAATKQYTDGVNALKLNLTGGTISGSLNVIGILSNASGIQSAGSIFSSSPTNGIGYTNGAGAAIIQTGTRTTGVTVNANCGTIQLVSAAGSATYASFTVTNSSVSGNDIIILNQQTGTDLYETNVTNVTSGSFRITFRTTGGTTTEQPIFNFAIIYAVNT